MISMGGIADFCKGTLAPRVASRLPSVLRFVASHRRDVAGGVIALAAVALILVNGLFMQSGPHPAPIFAIKPLPVVSNEPTGSLLPRPRPAAAAETVKFDPVPMPRPRAQQAVSRADPIADLINPPRPLSAVQRALNEYGYGPVKASGVYDDATRAAITQFEKDHNLPPTGQVTPRFKRELSVATGRPLD